MLFIFTYLIYISICFNVTYYCHYYYYHYYFVFWRWNLNWKYRLIRIWNCVMDFINIFSIFLTILPTWNKAFRFQFQDQRYGYTYSICLYFRKVGRNIRKRILWSSTHHGWGRRREGGWGNDVQFTTVKFFHFRLAAMLTISSHNIYMHVVDDLHLEI